MTLTTFFHDFNSPIRRHTIRVGDRVTVTDGEGYYAEATITRGYLADGAVMLLYEIDMDTFKGPE